MKKKELRKIQLEKRKNIQNKEEKSNRIFIRVIELEEYNSANTIGIYVNLPTEVSTMRLIEHSLSEGKRVCLPKTINDSMIFIEIKSLDNLIKSPFGVYEPILNEEKIIDSNEIDLMIVPGVAFDLNCNRIGFGKGYYDSYLRGLDIEKIALAFDEQIVDCIHAEETDVSMDKIVTESRIIKK